MHDPIPPPPPTVLKKIAGLPKLSIEQVRALWLELYGKATPSSSRQFLERRLAYRLQEIEARKTHADLLDENRRRIEALARSIQVPKGPPDYRLTPGTVLTRQYRGVEHEVRVLADGQFEFQGRPYRSLSAIAEELTGQRWSGPLFFGLRPRTRKAAGRCA